MAVQERGPEAGRDEVPGRDLAVPDAAPGPIQAAAGRARALAVRALAWADRPAVTGLIALLAATAFVLARWELWARRSIGRFILIGENFAHPSQLPAGMPLRAAYGYDGQFYYRLAINPLDFSRTAYGVTVDQAYRFMRDGYPMITWLASAGQRALVPYMLVAVNAVALGALGWLGGQLARQGGRHAAWGLLLPGYFGLVTSLGRDTAEPLAAAFLVAGLLAVRARRPALAAGLLAFAVLTRETAMVAVAALAVVRVAGLVRRRSRPGREDLAWLGPAAVFAAWQVVVYAVVGTFPLGADGDRNAGAPFLAAFDAIRYNLGHIDWSAYNGVDRWLAELAVLLLFAVAALCSLRTARAPAHERLALVLFLIEICVITPATWRSRTADLRSFVEVYVMAVIILLSRPRQPRPERGAWLLPAVTAGLLPVLGGIVMLRVHWS